MLCCGCAASAVSTGAACLGAGLSGIAVHDVDSAEAAACAGMGEEGVAALRAVQEAISQQNAALAELAAAKSQVRYLTDRMRPEQHTVQRAPKLCAFVDMARHAHRGPPPSP